MIDIFLDTDIIIDMLGNRKPFSKFAVEIFSKSLGKEIKVYVSGNSITTVYYILCKYNDEVKVRTWIAELLDLCIVVPATKEILRSALESDFQDYEDAVQHFSALAIGRIKAIVTRNVKDYRKSKIKVMPPEDFLLRFG